MTTTHPVDEILAPPKLFTLGLQHVLVMYAGAVAVPLIVGRTSPPPTSSTRTTNSAANTSHSVRPHPMMSGVTLPSAFDPLSLVRLPR